MHIEQNLEQSDKYYTPDISEFHVEFEYEIRASLGKDIWTKMKFDKVFLQLYYPEDCPNIHSEIKSNNIRVKYLGPSDIESLGFEYKGYNSKTDLFEFRYKNYILSNCNNKDVQIYRMCLVKTKDKPKGYYSEDYINIVFDGAIKNKSKLKQILEMVGVK